MLARTPYMTAAQLRIEEWEHKGLSDFVRLVRAREILACQFDMSINWNWCGSIGCVGGWIAILAGRRDPMAYVRSYDERAHQLNRLYYPASIHCGRWRYIMPERAANVVEYFLMTGEVNWSIE